MAVPHRQWLAEQTLSDQQTVSYRTLARALKVHVNAAKRMLYDFHSHENSKKPGSVHATYLLSGSKKVPEKPQVTNGRNGTQHEDHPVPSSPPPFTSSMLQSSQQNGDDEEVEISTIQTITLVREESLEAVKSSYETITSIHIYSLSSSRLQDLQTLSDTSRHLYSTHFVKEDPLEHNATYGVIVNKNVRRRTGRRPPPPNLEPKLAAKTGTASKTSSKAAENTATASQPSVKQEETSRPSSAGSTTRTSTTTKQSSLKRDTSDIFKSFAKAKNAKANSTPKLARNDTDSSVGNTSEDPDTKLLNASEGEGESEEEALFLDTQTRTSKKRSSTGKAEREAKLRRMMDDSDEEMEDTELIDPEETGIGTGDKPSKDGKSQETALEQSTAQVAEAEDAEAEAVNWSDSDTERQTHQKSQPKAESIPEPEPEQEPGHDPTAPAKRRRGKRKVMKKKTVKDEEGYLVTREEAVWESFSEDEPVPAKAKVKPGKAQSQSQGQGQGKGKQKGGGGGGGNIMAFFGKK